MINADPVGIVFTPGGNHDIFAVCEGGLFNVHAERSTRIVDYEFTGRCSSCIRGGSGSCSCGKGEISEYFGRFPCLIDIVAPAVCAASGSFTGNLIVDLNVEADFHIFGEFDFHFLCGDLCFVDVAAGFGGHGNGSSFFKDHLAVSGTVESKSCRVVRTHCEISLTVVVKSCGFCIVEVHVDFHTIADGRTAFERMIGVFCDDEDIERGFIPHCGEGGLETGVAAVFYTVDVVNGSICPCVVDLTVDGGSSLDGFPGGDVSGINCGTCRSSKHESSKYHGKSFFHDILQMDYINIQYLLYHKKPLLSRENQKNAPPLRGAMVEQNS